MKIIKQKAMNATKTNREIDEAIEQHFIDMCMGFMDMRGGFIMVNKIFKKIIHLISLHN